MQIPSFILPAVAVLLGGCVVHTDLRVTNRTGAVIHVYSGHTKKIATIAVEATVKIPHTEGRVIVITGQEEVWEYDNVRSVVDEASQSYKRVSLAVDIDPRGGIELPSGKTLTPTRMLA
ncbi:MAG TPA: hypothetical protein VF585_08530, partial [Chthoniobacterales bacterium]